MFKFKRHLCGTQKTVSTLGVREPRSKVHCADMVKGATKVEKYGNFVEGRTSC